MLDVVREPISVSELNEYVSALLAADPILRDVRVEGEISGFKRHSSGHLYFSLKDAHASVRAVMFRQNAMRMGFRPAEGMHVTATGYASLYARDGSFQLYVLAMEEQGEGALYQKFARLKKELEERGYFDAARKRPLPRLPRCVGVVTSGTGAALQDILQIIGRRYPTLSVDVCPVRVQGEGAAKEVADAIRYMNHHSDADVLIVGRGGGSIEDLWAFNEEIVAKAILDSRIPVISAVGHETDFTIADFVSDLRAPTPSAAAELAVPEYAVLIGDVAAWRERLQLAAQNAVSTRRDTVRLNLLSPAFHRVESYMAEQRVFLDRACDRMEAAAAKWMQESRSKRVTLISRLSALGPAAVMERGFAFVSSEAGGAVKNVSELTKGEDVRLHFSDGTAKATVTDIREEL